MSQAFTQGTFYGGAAALSTNTTLLGNIVGVDTAPEFSREVIETTNSRNTNLWATFAAGDIKDAGSISITWQYNTQLDYGILFNTGNDAIQITFPKRATSCGGSVATNAATWTAYVVLEKLSPAWKFDQQMVITGTFKISGQPAFVAAS
jgi:hypothetical protein